MVKEGQNISLYEFCEQIVFYNDFVNSTKAEQWETKQQVSNNPFAKAFAKWNPLSSVLKLHQGQMEHLEYTV